MLLMSYQISDSSGAVSEALHCTERGNALAQLLSVRVLLFQRGTLKCDVLTTICLRRLRQELANDYGSLNCKEPCVTPT